MHPQEAADTARDHDWHIEAIDATEPLLDAHKHGGEPFWEPFLARALQRTWQALRLSTDQVPTLKRIAETIADDKRLAAAMKQAAIAARNKRERHIGKEIARWHDGEWHDTSLPHMARIRPIHRTTAIRLIEAHIATLPAKTANKPLARYRTTTPEWHKANKKSQRSYSERSGRVSTQAFKDNTKTIRARQADRDAKAPKRMLAEISERLEAAAASAQGPIGEQLANARGAIETTRQKLERIPEARPSKA